MPAIVLRSSAAFLSLEVGTNRSRDLKLVLLRNRLVPAPCSGFLSVAWDSPGALLVLFLNLLRKLLPRELLQRLLEIEDLESFVEVPAELLLLERTVPL